MNLVYIFFHLLPPFKVLFWLSLYCRQSLWLYFLRRNWERQFSSVVLLYIALCVLRKLRGNLVFYIDLRKYHFYSTPFLPENLTFIWHHFSSFWKSFFSIYLVQMAIIKLLFNIRKCVNLVFLKIIFIGYRILGWLFWVFKKILDPQLEVV